MNKNPLPDPIMEALLKLSNELAKYAMKLHSVEIRRRPHTTDYDVHTSGGPVKIKQEV